MPKHQFPNNFSDWVVSSTQKSRFSETMGIYFNFSDQKFDDEFPYEVELFVCTEFDESNPDWPCYFEGEINPVGRLFIPAEFARTDDHALEAEFGRFLNQFLETTSAGALLLKSYAGLGYGFASGELFQQRFGRELKTS